MEDDALLELSRLTRRGITAAHQRAAAEQRGEIFLPRIRFVVREAAVVAAIALLSAAVLCWAVILSG